MITSGMSLRCSAWQHVLEGDLFLLILHTNMSNFFFSQHVQSDSHFKTHVVYHMQKEEEEEEKRLCCGFFQIEHRRFFPFR